MAKRKQSFTSYSYLILPDGSELLMTKVENLGQEDEIVTDYLTPEQRERFRQNVSRNASLVMSEYYAEQERRKMMEA